MADDYITMHSTGSLKQSGELRIISLDGVSLDMEFKSKTRVQHFVSQVKQRLKIRPPILTRDVLRIALQASLVCLAAYPGGFYFTRLFHGASAAIGGLWSLVSGVVVLQATRRDTLASAWLRVPGTFIGAAISALYLSFLPFNPFGMAAVIGVVMLLCQILGIPDHARLASITVAVIMVLSSVHPGLNPVLNAALRFSESCIGTALAVAAVLLWREPAAKGSDTPGPVRRPDTN